MVCVDRSIGLILSPRDERGQALAEFLTLAVALIPLFLLVPMIGKYQDLSHATQLASRYASFDAITRNAMQGSWKPEAQLADEVRRRFFSNSDAPIKTNDVAGDSDSYRNPFWQDLKGNPLVKNFNDVQLSFGTAHGASHADAFTATVVGDVFNTLPVVNAAAMGLQAHGAYTANVSVTLANLPAGIRSLEPLNDINLTIERHTSVVIDPWTSPSTTETEKRFAKLVPLNTLLNSPIQTLVDVAITSFDLAEVSPPKFGRLDIWRDVVPQDRLTVTK